MRSYQVRVGDEGQRWSTFDHIFHILTQEVCQVAEGAKDGKAGHEGGEAVGNADEEHVKDNVLVQVMLLSTQSIHVKVIKKGTQNNLKLTLWNLLKLARVGMVALPALSEKRICPAASVQILRVASLDQSGKM